MNLSFPVRLLIGLLLITSISFSAQAQVVTIGSISYTPAKEIKQFKPLIDYLYSKLEAQGIEKVNIRIASNIDEMISLMKSGQVDIYIDSPFPSLQLVESGASKIALRRWKSGVKEYHSVIFVHKDSDIEKITDLKGKLIAFEEPFSTSGYYLPKASLKKNGLRLTEKSSRHENVAADEIGYIFSEDDANTITWVRKLRVAAGATDNVTFDKIKSRLKSQLKIIFRSIDVPRQVVSYRKNISPATEVALTRALLDMHKSEYGQQQLQAFKKTARFDKFPVPVKEVMAPIEALADAFR